MKNISTIILLLAFSVRLQSQDYKEYWSEKNSAFQRGVIDNSNLYPGGEDSIKAYIYRNIKFTPVAIADNRNGNVHLKVYYENRTGRIINTELQSSLEYSRDKVNNLDDIAKRIVLSMPNLIVDSNDIQACPNCISETRIRVKFKYESWMPIDSSFIYARIQDSINEQKYREEQVTKANQEKEYRFRSEEESRKEYEAECIKKFGVRTGKIVSVGEVKIGMTKEMCRYSWGSPNRTSETLIGKTIYETWVYDNLSMLRFRAGKLYSIHK